MVKPFVREWKDGEKFKAFVERDKPRKRRCSYNIKKIKINTRKDNKNRHDIRVKERVDISPNKSYIVGMKEKIITIKPKGASPKQWSTLLLELNLMRKAWKPYGVDMSMSAPGLKAIINYGTNVSEYIRPSRRPGKRVQSNKGPRA